MLLKMQIRRVEAGTVLYKVGQFKDRFYFVIDGVVERRFPKGHSAHQQLQDFERQKLSSGQHFGDYAIDIATVSNKLHALNRLQS
jgi:CRP-like cAMP-binding protein